MCDNGDRVTSMNPRAGELVPGLRVGAAAHGPGSPLPQLAEALAGEVMVRRENDLTLAVTAARLAGPDGGTVWTLRDITERARLEQAKSDFVATASHELRSPLTSIKGFIELLETTNAENLTERQREFIAIVLKSTDRLVDLVNDLLDIARIESGQFEVHARSVDLRETIEEVAALMTPRLEGKRQQPRRADPRPAPAGARRSRAHAPGRDEPRHERPPLHRRGRHDHAAPRGRRAAHADHDRRHGPRHVAGGRAADLRSLLPRLGGRAQEPGHGTRPGDRQVARRPARRRRSTSTASSAAARRSRFGCPPRPGSRATPALPSARPRATASPRGAC